MRSLTSPIAALLFSVTISYGDNGSVSLVILKDGKPLKNSEVIIDNKNFKSDEDGWVLSNLEAGSHQLQLLGRDKKGSNIGYIKRPFKVRSGKDTLIIASFDSKDTIKKLSIDVPVKEDRSSKDINSKTRDATLSGRVLIGGSKKPLRDARVFIKGTNIEAKSDQGGYFSVKVPSQTALSLSVVHSAYSSKTINEIKVKRGKVLSKSIELTPASLELEEFVVLSPKIEGSIASVMAEEKDSNSIANILGSEQISKKGDSSAAGALKRVTGITLLDGKSVYVRGLGDRYSNVELNSLPLPSPDPTKRVVPLDIFPASVIGSLKIQKSSSADIPSSFGGGYINIRTKDKGDENFLKLSLGIKANSNTGKDTNTYQGGDTDWSGYDDYRALSSSILNSSEITVGKKIPSFTTENFSKEQLLQITKDFIKRDFSVKNQKLPIGGSGSLEGGYTYEIDPSRKLTFFGNYGYSQSHSNYEENFLGYDIDINGGLKEEASKYGTNSKSISSYSHGGMLNIGYSVDDTFKIKYTKLYTLNTKDSTRVVDGIMGSNYSHLLNTYLEWEEREMDINQLNGQLDYTIFSKLDGELNFGLEYARATLSQPNNFYYSRVKSNNGFVLTNATTNSISTVQNSDDTMIAGYLKNRFYLDIYSEDDSVDFGINYSFKERISRQRKFFLEKVTTSGVSDSELSDDIESIYDEYIEDKIDYDDLVFTVQQLFNPADYFDANVYDLGAFLSGFIKPNSSLEIGGGVKVVDIKQEVYEYKKDRTNPDMSKRNLIYRELEELNIDDIFPNINVKYKYTEDKHFDLAISKTYIMPDLREFTSGVYVHPHDVADVMGNPDLKHTEIMNLDLKYSYYISSKESLRIGAFYKVLDNPIEDVMIQSSSLPIYSFENANSADLYGLELDGRKDLSIIKEGLEEYYVAGNISFTNSKVALTPQQKEKYTSQDRQLQGLSDIVINTTLGYDTKKRSLAISYNKMGERIRKVGLIDGDDKYPDHIEVPPALLDFTWIEKVSPALKVSFKAKNILDDETTWKQGDRVTKRFKKGVNYSLGFSYKFTH
jgi:hypothetical protein